MTNGERWDAFIVEFRNYIEENLHLDNTKGILPAPLGISKCDALMVLVEKEMVVCYSTHNRRYGAIPSGRTNKKI